MMGSPDQPFTKCMPVKFLWINFYIKVIDHTADGHNGQLRQDYINVHGKKKAITTEEKQPGKILPAGERKKPSRAR